MNNKQWNENYKQSVITGIIGGLVTGFAFMFNDIIKENIEGMWGDLLGLVSIFIIAVGFIIYVIRVKL